MKKLILFTLALIGTMSAWAGYDVVYVRYDSQFTSDNPPTYTNLYKAVNNVNSGGTIIFLSDVSSGWGANINKPLTIDLKGYKYTYSGDGHTSTENQYRAIRVTTTGIVKFISTDRSTPDAVVSTPSATRGKIYATNSGCKSVIRVDAAGTVNVDNIEFAMAKQETTSGFMCIGYCSNSNGRVSNCKFITNDTYKGGGVYCSGSTVTVDSCEADFQSTYNSCGGCLSAADGGNLTINSGYYESNGAPCVNTFSSGGNIVINGGTFINNAETAPWTGSSTGNYTGAIFCYLNETNKSNSLTINGGSFTGYIYTGKGNGNTNTFSIDNGSFSTKDVYTSTGGSAGTPSKTVTDYVTSDNEFVKEGDNYVAVKKLPLTSDKYVRSVPASGCGTICLPNNAAQPAGVTFYGIVGKDKAEDPTYIVLDTVKTDLVAGTPYIFVATPASSMQFTLGTKPEYPTAAAVKGLIGTLAGVNWDATNSTALKADDETLDGKYLISGGEIKPAEAQGAYLAPNRAYIDLEEVPVVDAGAPGRKVYLSTNGVNTPTGLNFIENESAQAQKVMLNGKMFIRRGNQLFDAQGALVK